MGKIICPKCKSNNIIKFLYGNPTEKALAEVQKGNLILGDCIMCAEDYQHDRFCKDCGYKWSVDSLGPADIIKIRFRYSLGGQRAWSIDSLEEIHWVNEIYHDGTIKYEAHPYKFRIVVDRARTKIDPNQVKMFYEKIDQILKNEKDDHVLCDGSMYHLDITYSDKKKKSVSGFIHGGAIASSFYDFLIGIPVINEKGHVEWLKG